LGSSSRAVGVLPYSSGQGTTGSCRCLPGLSSRTACSAPWHRWAFPRNGTDFCSQWPAVGFVHL